MMRFRLNFGTLLLLAAGPAAAQTTPYADHHQHLVSPATVALLEAAASGPAALRLASAPKPITAADLIPLLDEAGIRRAVVLSVAYMIGSPGLDVDDEYERVKAENDWTGAEAARYPGRLRAFCSVNPLKSYALREITRCARDPRLWNGLKLHFGNSDVQVHDRDHVERLRQVFAQANRHRMAIVVHLRGSVARHRPHGREEAQVFLEEILPAAPDVPVTLAHLAGAGDYDASHTDAALEVFADAVARGDPRVANVWFDVTAVARPGLAGDKAELIAIRLRQLGMERLLYGSDAATAAHLAPRAGWAAFRLLPLSEMEIRRVAANVAPYLRDPVLGANDGKQR